MQSDVQKLAALDIDSRLWDSWDAYAPDGGYYFRPDTVLTHAQTMAALFIAQEWLGPHFFDNPADGRNGREPAAPSMRSPL